jgi:3-methyladenine DNA glycosylase AlkD
MTLKETLKQLKALGTAKVRAQNAKSGAGDNQFGVSLGDIRVLAKKIRTDHPLALSLWETGNVDAQFLATLLIQPKKLSADEMERMVRSSADPEVQWTMNNTLAAIGIHFPKHRKRAIGIGEKLGIYRDYPVSKGCTSPFAPIWINFMVSRQG